MDLQRHDCVTSNPALGVLDEIEDGYLELDIAGHITFANRAFSKIIGYPREILTGMNYRAYMDPESAEKCFKAFNHVFRTGRSEPSFGYDLIRKDGELRFVEYSISLLKDDHGAPSGFRCIIRDVTEQKMANEQIAQQRSLLKATFRSVQDAIVTVDIQGRIIEANQAASGICGVIRGRLRGSLYQKAFTRCSRACHEALAQTLQTRRPIDTFQVECRHPRKMNQTVKVTSSPLRDDDGQMIGAVMVLRDVTRLIDLERELDRKNHYRNIIGKSKKMMDIFSIIERLTEVDTTVLIIGESGTGKEMVARALHHSGRRALEPMITVNCAALSENLLESELFGHVKGAFTGAFRDSVGRFHLAEKGTIFLDEIGDISPKIQVKLLRVLQEKQFERVGDSTPISADVRIIAATNQDLKTKVKKNEFRLDFYYRLKVVELELPPLRHRDEDLALLIEHFCRRFSGKYDKSSFSLSEEVYRRLLEYHWPGNVRELENTMERLFVLSPESGTISSDLLPREIAGPLVEQERCSASTSAGSIGNDTLISALETTDWNIAKTARQLGISRKTVYRRLKRAQIRRPSGAKTVVGHR